jgi:hypothetical protein
MSIQYVPKLGHFKGGDFLANRLWQNLHWKGFTFAWAPACRRRCSPRLNLRPQTEQVYGFVSSVPAMAMKVKLGGGGRGDGCNRNATKPKVESKYLNSMALSVRYYLASYFVQNDGCRSYTLLRSILVVILRLMGSERTRFPRTSPAFAAHKLKIGAKTKPKCHSTSLLSVLRGMADPIYVLSYASAVITSQVSLEILRQSENTKTTLRRRST